MREKGAWRRGIVEAILVLAGILIAFWIDASWEERQALQLEADALSELSVEVAANVERVRQARNISDQYLRDVDRFLRSAPDELRGLPPDTIRSWTASLYRPVSFDPERAAGTVLASLPVSSAEWSAEARRLVSRLHSELDRTSRVGDGVVAVYARVRERLTRYAGRSAFDGRAELPSMIARVGSDVLAELRTDEDFVSAVIERAPVQSIHMQSLDQLMVTLDSLSVLLNES